MYIRLHDGQHALAPIGQNTKVATGRSLPAEVGTKAFALVHEKLFVTLNRDGRRFRSAPSKRE
jgi:hypothetical protein